MTAAIKQPEGKIFGLVWGGGMIHLAIKVGNLSAVDEIPQAEVEAGMR